MAQILLLETDRVLAGTLSRYLKRVGHQVVWEPEPQSAMDSADRLKPDVIILDLLLAKHSGVEFVYELRSYPDWLEIPLIIYSNVSEAELGPAVAGFTQLNIAAYHYKPAASFADVAQSVAHIAQPVTK